MAEPEEWEAPAPAGDHDGEPDRPRMGLVWLSLGSNLGDRVRNLERALERLRGHLYIEAISSVYETQPVEVHDQPWFLNIVCQATTPLKPRALLEWLLELEAKLGRRRGERYGPRVIDIDLLAYDDRVIDEPDLQLPHPRIAERRFILEPLREIEPNWRHPVSGVTVGELLAQAPDAAVRVFAAPPSRSGPSPLL